MQPIDTSGMSQKDFVSVTLRQCALLVDPRYGRLSSLGERIDTHETSIRLWIRQGYIPEESCRRLLKEFGKKWVNFDRLTGGA